MPAIKPVELKIQASELAEHFSTPDEFLRGLHDLLGYYADRTLRSSRVTESALMLNSYKVPRVVLLQIERALIPYVSGNPGDALTLADRLWQQKWLETRLLAVKILGRIPPTDPERFLSRVQEWGVSCKEEIIIHALLSDGIKGVRSEHRNSFLEAVERWLQSSEISEVLLGLRALPPLLEDETFENLPLIYRWLGPLVREVELAIKDDLVRVLRALSHRSPRETSYYLLQFIMSSAGPQMAPIARQVVDEFPPDIQAIVRKELRQL